jgi:sugar O-acyltransferase (sialic acid O-acetyltransferase NeuD family)
MTVLLFVALLILSKQNVSILWENAIALGKEDNMTERPLFGLFGTGGFARTVMPILRENIREHHRDDADVAFVDNAPASTQLNGVRIISTEAFLAGPRATTFFNVALADPQVRAAMCERFLDVGFQPMSIISRHAIVMGPADIGPGAIICGFCTITTNIRIGRFFHANIYSYVEHDAVIGDYVTFAPRVNCNGNITINDFVYIGAAAAIRQGGYGQPVVIGRGAVVGMGAVVLNSVAEGETVVGNPARPIRKKASAESTRLAIPKDLS